MAPKESSSGVLRAFLASFAPLGRSLAETQDANSLQVILVSIVL
jgi:hypothetical protein